MNMLRIIWGGVFLLYVFSSSLVFAQEVMVYEPWETVALEHADRVNRLKRIAKAMRTHQPEFFEYMIPREKHQLPDFPVDMPVLRVVYPEDVFFASDSSDLTVEAMRVIDNVAASLWKEPADVTVFIVGHTDSLGTERYNLELGKRRAQSVAQDFAYRRVPQSQIYRVSFGEFAPVASNATTGGQARNRRVEFLFAARPEPIAIWLLEEQKNILEVRAAQASLQANSLGQPTRSVQGTEKESIPGEEGKVHLDPPDPKNVSDYKDESLSGISAATQAQRVIVDRPEPEALNLANNPSEQSFSQNVQDITIEAESVEVTVDSEDRAVLEVGRKIVVLNLTQKKLNLVTR